MGLLSKDDGWRISDMWWEHIQALLPSHKPHPLGCHNPRMSDRSTKVYRFELSRSLSSEIHTGLKPRQIYALLHSR